MDKQKQQRITVGIVKRRRWPMWLRSRTRQPITSGSLCLPISQFVKN